MVCSYTYINNDIITQIDWSITSRPITLHSIYNIFYSLRNRNGNSHCYVMSYVYIYRRKKTVVEFDTLLFMCRAADKLMYEI